MNKTRKIQKMAVENTHWEEGSDNVFSDLGFEDSEELIAKAKLVLCINQIIKQNKLTQIEAAKILGVDQAKISYLHRGRLAGFSIERLVKFLNLLNQDVELVVKESKKKAHHGGLHVVVV